MTPVPSIVRLPTAVDGMPVLTVSEVLAKRAAGELRNQPVALGGFWSTPPIDHSCTVPPSPPPGELELYCTDGESGITELDEWNAVFSPEGRMTPARGPHLSPYVLPAISLALYEHRVVDRRRASPIPIVVVGHFDDPRAALCRPAAQDLCRDRFVIDRIVALEPSFARLPPPSP